MIAVIHDVYGERVRGEVHVDETDGHAVLDIRHRLGTASRLHRADAVSLLRAMLREIAGPSIDDVREVWGAKVGDVYARRPATRDGLYDVQVWDGDRTRTFMDSDLREALQAAYDAGVEKRGDG